MLTTALCQLEGWERNGHDLIQGTVLVFIWKNMKNLYQDIYSQPVLSLTADRCCYPAAAMALNNTYECIHSFYKTIKTKPQLQLKLHVTQFHIMVN